MEEQVRMEAVKVTILVDNKVSDGLTAEHGLSLWIQAEGKNILFDTGQGTALEYNSRALGVNLSETDILVLSHGHYDHTGGIPLVFQSNRQLDVYCHPDISLQRFMVSEGTSRPIHIPASSLSTIEKVTAPKIHWVTKEARISDNIGITGPIPRETVEDVGGPFFLDPEGNSPDLINDDMALWIRLGNDLLVFVGCGHSGLINTLIHIQRLNPRTRFRAIMGGLHLINANHERMDLTISALRMHRPELVIPCHCTGDAAAATLQSALGDCVKFGAAGQSFTFAARN